jgi:hypothetical protein
LVPVITALILICSATVAMRDCNTETAIDVVQGPEVNSVFECGFSSQAIIAQTSMAPALGTDRYLKIICVRQKRVAAPVHPDLDIGQRD